MTMEIDNIIKDYVNAKDTDYAIMIDGEWGSGKSWYWNNVLTEINKQMIFLLLLLTWLKAFISAMYQKKHLNNGLKIVISDLWMIQL